MRGFGIIRSGVLRSVPRGWCATARSARKLLWLVNVVEDGLYAILANAGAVLDVVGALEVGESSFHATLEGGNVGLYLFELVGVEDDVLFVFVLPFLPEPAP